MIKTVVTIIIFFLASLAQAQVPLGDKDRQTYLKLTEDFFEEVMTMDAVTETDEERLLMVKAFREILKTTGANQFRFEPGLSWSNLWPPQRTMKPGPPVERDSTKSFETISLSHSVLKQDKHSIKNLREYIGARLGIHSANLIEKGEVVPIVLGGSEMSIRALLSANDSEMHKIPSFYETWGISKWMVSGEKMPDGKARLVYIVPPAQEYLEHYQYMLTQLTGREQNVVRNKKDYLNWKNNFSEAAKRVKASLGERFDFVTLGYFNQWLVALESEKARYRFVEIPIFYRDSSGLMARKFTVYDRQVGREISLLSLGHEKVIWGEASAEIIGSFLRAGPRAVVFMGSAGSISNKSHIYDLSVPLKFRTNQGELETENFVQSMKRTTGKVKNVPVAYNIIHGSTSSPAAQTLNYLTKHSEVGEDTIDVEQSLIAKKVSEYNFQHASDIQFGAINLIADKSLGDAEHSLDKVDHLKKSQARLAAVSLAIQAIGIQRVTAMGCGRVHR